MSNGGRRLLGKVRKTPAGPLLKQAVMKFGTEGPEVTLLRQRLGLVSISVSSNLLSKSWLRATLTTSRGDASLKLTRNERGLYEVGVADLDGFLDKVQALFERP